MSLKDKTINGLIWSFLGNFANQAVTFVVGIILARLLSPREYGLIGMVTIFIVISQTFIDSGFKQALIRKKDCTPDDFSTVFYFNLLVGIIFYFILFFAAETISNFYNEPELTKILRVLGISLIIGSFSVIQTTILTKQINFKLQTKILFISALLSGLLGIIMAYKDYGVWSLVMRGVFGSFVSTLLFWLYTKWKPNLVFSMKSFKDLFGFGSKLLASNLIDQFYWNIYYVVIGKYFSAQSLGLYSRAEMFKNLPSQNITFVISGVGYPVLAQYQDNTVALKMQFKKILQSTMLITFFTIILMISTGRELILLLIGIKWMPALEYFYLLCVVGLFFPLIVLNSLILKVKGRSDILLYIQISTKLLSIPIIVIGISYGIRIMIIGTIFQAILEYILVAFWTNKLLRYRLTEQITDILPSFLITSLMGTIVFLFGLFQPFTLMLNFALQIFFGLIFIITLNELLKLKEYLFIKQIFIDKLQMQKKK